MVAETKMKFGYFFSMLQLKRRGVARRKEKRPVSIVSGGSSRFQRKQPGYRLLTR
jgi:hypothetical protein